MLFIGLFKRPDDLAEVLFRRGKTKNFRIKAFIGRKQLCAELSAYRKNLLAGTPDPYLGMELYCTTGRRFALDFEIPAQSSGQVVLSVSELEGEECCQRFSWRGNHQELAEALRNF